MPAPLTQEQRAVDDAHRATDRGGPERVRAIDDRGQPLRQQDPYATRPGPLMSMMQALDRAQRVAVQEQDKRRLEELRARQAQEARMREAIMRGGAAARLLHSKHQALTGRGKGNEGIGFGVVWLARQAIEAEQDDQARAAYFARRKAALEKRGLSMVSCLTMPASTLPSYVDGISASAGQRVSAREELGVAIAKAEDSRGTGKQFVFGGRATVLLDELRTRFGFETVHIDSGAPEKPDANYTSDAGTRKSHTVPNKPAFVTGADTRTRLDVRVGVDRFIKLGKKMTPESRNLWEELQRVEYAVGIADSGMHTYVLSAGNVYEFHWDKGPTSKNLTSAIPLRTFFQKWHSGVIAVPPSILTQPPEGTKQ
jgi:hypothetical protein